MLITEYIEKQKANTVEAIVNIINQIPQIYIELYSAYFIADQNGNRLDKWNMGEEMSKEEIERELESVYPSAYAGIPTAVSNNEENKNLGIRIFTSYENATLQCRKHEYALGPNGVPCIGVIPGDALLEILYLLNMDTPEITSIFVDDLIQIQLSNIQNIFEEEDKKAIGNELPLIEIVRSREDEHLLNGDKKWDVKASLFETIYKYHLMHTDVMYNSNNIQLEENLGLVAQQNYLNSLLNHLEKYYVIVDIDNNIFGDKTCDDKLSYIYLFTDEEGLSAWMQAYENEEGIEIIEMNKEEYQDMMNDISDSIDGILLNPGMYDNEDLIYTGSAEKILKNMSVFFKFIEKQRSSDY